MSKKNLAKDLLAQLGKQAAADVPPVMAKMNEVPTPPSPVAPAERRDVAPAPPPPGTAAKPSRPLPGAVAGGGTNRTGVNFSGPALAALRRLQAFFLTECGGSTVSASAVVCIALEHTAAGLPGNQAELAALLDAARQADNRRRSA